MSGDYSGSAGGMPVARERVQDRLMGDGGSECTKKQRYDLEERTALFGEAVMGFAKLIAKDEITRPLLSQVVRSATSIGANYMEADDTQTKKDFRNKIGLCLRESKETKHWLRMLAKADEKQRPACRKLWQEVQELTLIFASILRNAK